MLTKLIVELYVWIIEIALWFILLVSGVAGFLLTVPALKSAGGILEIEIAWKIAGAVLLPVAVFLMLAVAIGPFLVLVDIRKTIRAFETTNSRNISGIPQAEYREPHL